MMEQKKMPYYMKFVMGGLAGMTSTCFLQPIDLVKIRMQMAGVGGKKREYKHSLDCFLKVIKNEGILKCWQGLGAGLLRQATYTTTRMGVYEVLIDQYKINANSNPTVAASMIMGVMAGAAGGFVCDPAEVALVRMVTDGTLPTAERRNYKGSVDALKRIIREERWFGICKNCLPTVGRAMVVNMCQLASYSQVKMYLSGEPFKIQPGFGLCALASCCSGAFTSVTSIPFDVAKTRIQNMKTPPGATPEYTGITDALTKIYRNEGVSALWKGFTLYFIRLIPHTLMTFAFLELYSELYCKYVLGTTGGSNI